MINKVIVQQEGEGELLAMENLEISLPQTDT
jgi:hypothetical protein